MNITPSPFLPPSTGLKDATLARHLGSMTRAWLDYARKLYVDMDYAHVHVTSTGEDHSYIDQDVTTDGTPSFEQVYVTGGDEPGHLRVTATDVGTSAVLVRGEIASTVVQVRRASANTGAGSITGEKGRGTLVSPSAAQSADVLFNISASGHDGTGWQTPRGRVRWVATENWDGSSHGNKIEFQNTADGATAVSTRITIDQDGAVSMPAVYDDTVGATNRDLFIDNAGKIGAEPSAARYKTNIRELDGSERIFLLRPVRFDRKDEATGKNLVGLIAEEVDAVMPDAVSYRRESHIEIRPGPDGQPEAHVTYTTTDEPETVNYSRLIVPMLKEIQRLREAVERLEARPEPQPRGL